MLLLYGVFILVAAVGGWRVVGSFESIQKNTASETLERHEDLTRLNVALARLLEKIQTAAAAPTAQRIDELWLSLDTTYAVMDNVHLEKLEAFGDVGVEVSNALADIEALLEAPGALDAVRAKYLADRLSYVNKEVEGAYLTANSTVVSLLRNQSQILDGLGNNIVMLLGLLFFSATLMVALIYWLRRFDKARESSARRFRSIVESAGDAMYIHDRYGKVFDVNQVASEQTGYTREELLDLSVAQLDAAIDFEKLRDTWDLGEADPEQYPMTLETAHRRKDGTTFPIEVRISLLVTNEATWFVAMVRDITERNQTERELDFQKRALDEHAIVSIADVKGDIIYINDKFCDISGYSREELMGHNHRIVKSNEHSQAFYKHLWKTITSGKPWRGEIRNLKKGGGAYWVDATIVPFMNENGKPFQYVAIRTDITERKIKEKAALIAQEEAERANRAKSEFLSAMSHELRTPLNAILGFGQLLDTDPDYPLSAEQKESVDHIIKGGSHLLELINEVLDLAKIESGKLSFSIEPVAPGPVLKSCMTMAAKLAAEHNIEIDDQTAVTTLPQIMADQTRLKQVLLNLISNAIKYNRKNGRVTIASELVDQDHLRFMVSDTGMGIPADRQAELFQPFHRLGHEGSTIEGTGIGLTISQKLIGLMGGNIDFESIEGEGSTFSIVLPLADSKAADKANEDLDARPAPDADLSGGKTNRIVLYIEDNPANLQLMSKIIKRVPGLELITAHTAEIGLTMAKHEHPDLILMDINLPGMDGIEAMGHLQANNKTRHIPVIAVSAAAMVRDIERGREAGFRDYLTKPINVDQTLDAIKLALEEPG